MRFARSLVFACCFISLLTLVVPRADAGAMGGARVVTSFDPDWRFIHADPNDAQSPEFDDAAWRKLDVPHDWSIEGPVDPANPSGGAGGFFPDGVGWYRKHFSVPDADAQKHFFIDFDGIMANSDVWINGFHLGNRPYGYVSLHYDLTSHLNVGPGKSNVLAVRVNQQQQPASRYYMGAGINRHVRLTTTDPVHLEHDSVFVSTPQASADAATVHVQGTILNQSDQSRQVSVQITLLGPDGQPVPTTGQSDTAQSIPAAKSLDFSQDLQVKTPGLWDLDHPRLYRAIVSIVESGKTLDDQTTPFGIRTFKFVPETGFWLNDKNIRIQGACLHMEGSAFGMAVPMGVWERRLRVLREYGVNALRLAHNPPDPAFLDLCDRLGFVVMDEMFDCWDVGKNTFDYHVNFDKWSLVDLRDVVRRDRNHPSIFLYSAGNEIHDTPNAQASLRILAGLVKEFHANDPTRPVTQALFRPNVSHDYDDGLADLLDVVGTNYRMSELLAAQKAKPTRTLVGTEDQLGDLNFLAKNPPLSGIFLWVGIDYLGESRAWPLISSSLGLLDRVAMPRASAYQTATYWTSKPFVHIVRGVGRGGAAAVANAPGTDPDIPDIAPPAPRGAAQPAAGQSATGQPPITDGPPATTAATSGPTATTAPTARAGRGARGGRAGRGGAAPGGIAARGPLPRADWTPTNKDPHPETVTVYSNCPNVELSLNGQIIGSSNNPTNGARNFSVTFAPGALKAVAYDAAGKWAATEELHTAGPATHILLVPEKTTLINSWDDVCFVRATVVDATGNPVPDAKNEISFKISGPATLAALDSADPANHEPFQSSQRQVFNGVCFAILKANNPSGRITITASADGLESATASIQAAPAP